MKDKDKAKRLQATINKINKTYGEGTVMTASDALKAGRLTKRVLKTTSLEVNDLLKGGFCGLVELFGPESSGKTSLAIETLALNQKLDPDFVCGWLETEGSVTEDILALHGIDFNRLVFWRQEDIGSAESALDVSRGLLTQNVIDCLVINSVAGLVPKVESESDLEKQNMALTARLMSKYLRIITGIASKNNITIVFINQQRENVGVMYGNPLVTTGGKALRYYASQRMQMRSIKLETTDPVLKPSGFKIRCRTEKNRFGPEKRECTYYGTDDKGIDSTLSIAPMLIEKHIVEVKGGWIYYKDDKDNIVNFKGQLCKWHGKQALLDSLQGNKSLMDMFLSKLNVLSRNLTDEEIKQMQLEEKQYESNLTEEEKQAINEAIEQEAMIEETLIEETE